MPFPRKMASEDDNKETGLSKQDLGLLEEDDEFEEFPVEDWGASEEDASDKHVWEDDWDDSNVEDSFSKQLRAELEKHGQKVQQQEAMQS